MPDRVYGGRSTADRRAERRRRLLDAGLEQFGTAGYAATSIEKLCAVAGVSTRNFYEEFPSREALLTALYDEVHERALRRVADAFASAAGEPLARRVELAVWAYITATAQDPRWARLSSVEIVGVSEAVERHRLAWRDRWVRFLEAEARRAVERGEAMSRNFHLSAVALIGAVNELVYHWANCEHRIPVDEVVAEIVRVATAALTGP
ncbi:TetR/AcrR family transcriptional regulator [Prauserella muralis]|uniref:Transcriptional regulator n=1 Tax=Prauserella muralis TaxID=588067 RepID=A0A2V4AIA3_9PSEU|nr:TetR/AcrR family transcriptional regulator [Prauserella muralis]PXY19280.1 transcriptional regulator [Prauserella muralis]TWE29219.1 TetR family transcriptional regulator [Prauserella muralis]